MQLHLCVMHGGLAIDASGHTAHSAHGATSHDAHHSTPGGEKSQQCSCLGDCATGTAPAFVGAPNMRVAITAVVRAELQTAVTLRPVQAASLLLPYSNGPPTTVSLA